jgi:hypothetical protein
MIWRALASVVGGSMVLMSSTALRWTTRAHAELVQPEASPWHADFEVDPLAYAFRGYSLHVGIGYKHGRLDLGTFAADLPSFMDTDGFNTSAQGFGLKLQFFPFAEQHGFFFGVDSNLTRAWVQRENTELAVSRRAFSAGVLVGARIKLPAGFYATPWIGVSYSFSHEPLLLGGATYGEGSGFGVFPTIHLGYQWL